MTPVRLANAVFIVTPIGFIIYGREDYEYSYLVTMVPEIEDLDFEDLYE